jgi:hypothetical protein
VKVPRWVKKSGIFPRGTWVPKDVKEGFSPYRVRTLVLKAPPLRGSPVRFFGKMGEAKNIVIFFENACIGILTCAIMLSLEVSVSPTFKFH